MADDDDAREDTFARSVAEQLASAAPASSHLDRLELIDSPDDNTVTIRAHYSPRRDG